MSESTGEQRLYTVEEANDVLPALRERLERVREARRVLFDSAEVVRERAEVNGGGPEANAVIEASRSLRRDVEAFAADGVILRDADQGLLDFPAQREGRVVFLCWREGEASVGHWHEVDSGFPGRKPL